MNYVHLIQSNNIIEVDQIIFALSQAGVEVMTKGKKALETGSVELTGIEGASIWVPEDKVDVSKNVLTTMGLAIQSYGSEADEGIPKAYIILGIILTIVIIAMIIVAIRG
jgi:hypothetical protein